MGKFNPDNYHYKGDWDAPIVAAREDLESDFPGARVFINSKSDTLALTKLLPPDGQDQVVHGEFEVSGPIAVGPVTGTGKKTYQYTVFSEGTLRCTLPMGPGGSTWSANSQATIKEVSAGFFTVTFLTWKRHDGSTRIKSITDIDLENWMSKLSDDLLLSQLTIAGTHNSHAVVGTTIEPTDDEIREAFSNTEQLPGFLRTLLGSKIGSGPVIAVLKAKGFVETGQRAAECQGWSVKDQLKNGVRFLDFRYGDDLNMRHGQIGLRGNLRDCIKDVNDFLDSHPRETVVVLAKWDKWQYMTNKGYDESDEVCARADQLFKDSPHFLDTQTVPTLGNCRGKLIRKVEGKSQQGLRFENFEAPSSFPRPNVPPLADPKDIIKRKQSSWLQTKSYLDWNLDVGQRLGPDQKTTILAAGLNDYHIDLDSIKSNSSILPVDFSKHKNEELRQWLDQNCAADKVYPLGFVTLDFADIPGQDLLKKLVLTNFT